MHIIVAPDSFKGSLSASQVVAAVAAGIRRVSKKIKITGLPLADGGEGTAQALAAAQGGTFRTAHVTGPLGRPINARYCILKKKKAAVIEMAACAGLPLVPAGKRNPLITTTYGVGELILRAVRQGCREIILGAGGSATVDGGMGMLQALGIKFLDKKGKALGRGGKELSRLHSINTAFVPPEVRRVRFLVAVDVSNPLCGKTGAARVYGPQKGATPKMVADLDRGLARFAKITKGVTGIDIAALPGAGAAGGLGAGAAAFLGAEIVSGVALVLGRAAFESHLITADVVITGEGRTDAQTAFGKAPLGAARLCKKHRVPCICLSGGLDEGVDVHLGSGFTAFFSITDGPCTVDWAMENAALLLERAAANIVRLFRAGR